MNRFSYSIYAIKIRFEPMSNAIRLNKFAIRFEKDLNYSIITYFLNFQTQCQIRVTFMYLFAMCFRFEHRRAIV